MYNDPKSLDVIAIEKCVHPTFLTSVLCCPCQVYPVFVSHISEYSIVIHAFATTSVLSYLYSHQIRRRDVSCTSQRCVMSRCCCCRLRPVGCCVRCRVPATVSTDDITARGWKGGTDGRCHATGQREALSKAFLSFISS